MNRVTFIFNGCPSLRVRAPQCETRPLRGRPENSLREFSRLRAPLTVRRQRTFVPCEGRAPRAPRLRALAFLITASASMTAWAQTGCEDVPEARRAQCEKVMDCMTIEDADVRRACINAAQRETAEESPSRQTVQPERVQQPARQVSPGEHEAPAPRIEERSGVRERTVRPTQAEAAKAPPTLDEQTVGTRRPASQPTRDAAQPEPLRAPPDSFTGEVTRIHQSVLDRQVIALDNRYVFVSDQAAQARLKVGQSVEAVKARSRIRAGRTWRLTGPSRRPIDAFRARCERDDIGSDDRRRCERMLER